VLLKVTLCNIFFRKTEKRQKRQHFDLRKIEEKRKYIPFEARFDVLQRQRSDGRELFERRLHWRTNARKALPVAVPCKMRRRVENFNKTLRTYFLSPLDNHIFIGTSLEHGPALLLLLLVVETKSRRRSGFFLLRF